MKNSLLLLIFLIFSVCSEAQSLIGLQSNYSGSHSTKINPASLTTSNLYMDLGLFDLGLMAYNDFFYIDIKDILMMCSAEGFRDYHIYKNSKGKNLKESMDLNLLSFMYNFDGVNAIGFSFNTRIYTSMNNIPWEMPEMILYKLEDNPQYYQRYASENALINTMEWAELGFTYSRTLYERYQDKIDVGANLKLLLGYASAYFDMKNVDYTVANDTMFYVHSFKADVSYSMPVNYDNDIDAFKRDQMIKGVGVGADLGIIYTRKKNTMTPRKTKTPCSYPVTDYYYKIGVSLLDFGSIKYNKNAEKWSFDKPLSNDIVVFSLQEMDSLVDSFSQLTSLMNGYYYGNPDKPKDGDNFRMGLPSAVSIQFDWNLNNNFFLNFTAVQPIQLYKYSVSRPSQIMLAPRYESRIFDATFTVTLNDYRYFLVGAAVRFAFITIGTQNSISAIGITDRQGMDVFISIKYNFNKGKCYSKRDACWSNEFGNIYRHNY